MRSYSLDLRERIVAARRAGQTELEVASRFGVSLSTVSRYRRLERRQESLLARQAPGKTPSLLPKQESDFLSLVRTRTDWTLETLRFAWQEHEKSSGGMLLSKSALHRHLQRLKVTYKKRASKRRSDLTPNESPS